MAYNQGKRIRNIAAPLDETLWEDFETVQRFHGMESNADVVRFLIRKEARQIRSQGALAVQATVPVAVGVEG